MFRSCNLLKQHGLAYLKYMRILIDAVRFHIRSILDCEIVDIDFWHVPIDDVHQVADGGKPTLEQEKIKRIRPMGQTASQPSEQNWADRCRLEVIVSSQVIYFGKVSFFVVKLCKS